MKIRAKKWHTNALRRLRMTFTFDGQRPASQYLVAKAIGVGLNRYFTLEGGRVPATPREAKELAALFQVDQRELLLDIKEPNVSPKPVVRTKPARRGRPPNRLRRAS